MLVAQLCLALCDPQTIALQAPLSMEFSRQEYWSGLPCPPPGNPLQGIFPTQGSNPSLLYYRQILYHKATREAQGTYASVFPPGNLSCIMEEQSENCFSSHTHAMEYYSSVVRSSFLTHQTLKSMVNSHMHITQ